MKIDANNFVVDIYLILSTIVIYFLYMINIMNNIAVFIILNLLLATYLLINLRYKIKKDSLNAAISLTGIFIFFQFGIQVVVGNFSLFFITNHFNRGWFYINKSMLLSIIGCIGIMIGFRSKNLFMLGCQLRDKIISRKHIYIVNHFSSFIVFLISFFAHVLAINMGVLGYASSSTLQNFIRFASISQYLVYLSDLSLLIVFLYFIEMKRSNNVLTKILFTTYVSIRLILSLISGMKIELFVIPLGFIIIYFFERKKISKFISLLMGFTIIFTYRIFDSFRALLRTDGGVTRVSALFDAITSMSSGESSIYELFVSILSRLNVIESSSSIVYYKDLIGLSSTDPRFLIDLLLVPITTIIPRTFLPLKSMSTYGLWVSHSVYGLPISIQTSSYVTIQGFFYLAGGFAAVFFGFLALGLFLNFCSGIVNISDGNLLLVAILVLISYKELFEASTPVAIFSGVTRGIIIYIIFGLIVTKKKRFT
jgi:hypothetical protein